MRSFGRVLTALAIALAGVAESSGAAPAGDCLPFAPRNPEGNHIVPGALGDIVYRRAGGREISLDAYVQEESGRRPLVVVVHGGAPAGSRVSFVGQFLELLTDAGFNWVSIDRRSTLPDGADDVAEALTFVRCHAAELRADPEKLVLLGEHAGADLAAEVTRRRAAGLVATVLIGGRYDLPDRPSSAAGPPDRPLAPVLAIHGSSDTEVPASQAAAFCSAYVRQGGGCERLIVNGASHRPENWWPRQWGYKRRLVEWLTSRVGDPGPHVPYQTRLRKRVVFDPEEHLTLDLWTPEGPGPFPLVVLAHGGGWEAGDRVTYIAPLFEPLARAGFAWCSIDYRLTPQVQHPAQLRDLRAALAYARANARAWHVDPARIALVGESASAQMVTQVATTDARLAGVVSFYGVYDFLPMVTDASPRSLVARLFGRAALDDQARDLLRQYSPLYHVHRGMPPVLLVHGTNERLWDQGQAMAREMTRVGANVELVRLDGAPHGMENWEGVDAWSHYKTRVVEWLRRRFAPGR